MRATLNRAQAFLRWLRQLICIHGPILHRQCPVGWQPYAVDVCARCGKITMKYRAD